MSLDLDGKYVVAVWMIPLDHPKDTNGRTYPSGDWLATLYKEKGKVDYVCHMRFRYYVDDKVHDSDDVKSGMVGTFTGQTETQALETVAKIAEVIAEVSERGGGKRPEIHKLIIRSDDPPTIFEHLNREDFFHAIKLTDGEKKAPSKNEN